MTQVLTERPKPRPAWPGSWLRYSTQTPPPPLRQPLPDPDTVWVLCWCGYEREAGQECGLPCM